MLTHLAISNYALIRQLEMTPARGLNMITGETGAGKSIMLGAIGLLVGNRADTKVLYDEGMKCVIEGTFLVGSYGLKEFFDAEELDYDETCIIRREISPNGKSRAFVNDTPVRVETLKQLGKTLLDIHSQHETLLLGAAPYQLGLIDSYAQTADERSSYLKVYKAYVSRKNAYEKRVKEAADLRKEADYNRFQLDELDALNLREGEVVELEEQQSLLEHAEEIKAKINEAILHLDHEELGALKGLSVVSQALNDLSGFGKQFAELKERFQSAYVEIQDIQYSLAKEDDSLEIDFDKLEETRERLTAIYQLQKKHGLGSEKELIQLAGELAEKVFQVDNLEDELSRLKKEMDASRKEMIQLASKLSKKRIGCLDGFAENLRLLLQQLGMENAQVAIQRTETTPDPSGIDLIEIFFSANKGVKPQPLAQVASGGEFARFMFAVKYIMAEKVALPTLIFDEIDTGISGEIALQLVKMMQRIATKHQVICISHLPQVAAKGEKHYHVFKDNSQEKTISKIKVLEPAERLVEIAQMIAGANPSPSAFESAKELLRG
ncbi:DNA repair protein RecN [Lunatimonas lonarensis]|uniref:DNA repair protein RecN n=1 Tax=Lunatimonas lonarensis TaxID=1232681 RepID=R7ZLU1_9BACT|nr:DNA repair protein RecN [Lunatimonas lonarensis]EON75061.1 DNA repair protein RecN [Lunatimonas lonarensis]